jgi:hypothetical protein
MILIPAARRRKLSPGQYSSTTTSPTCGSRGPTVGLEAVYENFYETQTVTVGMNYRF